MSFIPLQDDCVQRCFTFMNIIFLIIDMNVDYVNYAMNNSLSFNILDKSINSTVLFVMQIF